MDFAAQPSPAASADALPAVAPAWTNAVKPVQKAEILLDLVKRSGAEAEALFKTLPLAEQTDVVLSVPPASRLDLLLLPEDAGPLVQSLPELELHKTVLTVGKWEAQEVVEVASENQINFMLDHDCWRGESLDSRKFTDWLQLFLECDESQIFRILTAINADLLAFALKKHVKFEKDFMIEETYFLDPDWVKGSNPVVQQFLERLYALDPNLWVRLLGWVRMHSKGTIEADAVEGRETRLRCKGIPAPSLAITVYYPVDFDVRTPIEAWRAEFEQRQAAAAGMAADGVLPVLRQGGREALFLQRVVQVLAEKAGPDEPFAGRLEAELVDVANKVMVADQVDLGDMQRQKEAVDKVRRWISLGLEMLSGSDPARGAEWLGRQPVDYSFRLGSMLYDALGTAIVDLVKIEQRTGGRLSGSDFGDAYLALSEPEPMLPVTGRQGNGRHLMTLADYRQAWTLVWELEKVGREPVAPAAKTAATPPAASAASSPPPPA